jgi:hypothetical protein
VTAAGPATPAALTPLPDPRTAVARGAVVRQGLAESPPERWRRAAGPLLSSTSAPDGSLRLHRAVIRSARRGGGRLLDFP